MNLPGKIISGGQTGVDRAALDFAIERGIPHGGWCPAGRRAEDWPLDARYLLTETESAGYADRTLLNIRESTATLVLYDGRHLPISPGTNKTIDLVHRESRLRRIAVEYQPYTPFGCVVNLHPDACPAMALRRFASVADFAVLNIAGPRESKAPGIYAATLSLLREVWP